MRRKRRDEISRRLVSGLGGCIASPSPAGGALGCCWGVSSFLLSPYPLESLTEKKTGHKTIEMFTKHTFHSTVNPLDAKQTHKEPLLPGHRGPKGRPHRPASLGFI